MTESIGLQKLRREVIFVAVKKKLTKAERSEVAKATWRKRKRAGGAKKKSAAASKRSATKRSVPKQ